MSSQQGRRQVFRPAEHLTFFIPEHEDASVCLVRQLLAWKGISPVTSPSDPVFVVADRAGAPVPLTRRLADPVFKATLGRHPSPVWVVQLQEGRGHQLLLGVRGQGPGNSSLSGGLAVFRI